MLGIQATLTRGESEFSETECDIYCQEVVFFLLFKFLRRVGSNGDHL